MSQLPNNITELIAALEGLNKKNLNDEYELFGTCRGVFEKLKRLSDFDPSDVKKIIKILGDLPPEIKELEIEELEIGGKKLETRALNKQDLKQLLEDYEKAQNEKEREKIENDFYLMTGRKNVTQFIRIQNEIASKNQKKLEKLNPEIKERIVEEFATNRLSESDRLLEIIENSSLVKNQEISTKELKKELKEKNCDSEDIESIIEKTPEIKRELLAQKKEISEKQISPEIKEKIVEVLTLGGEGKKEELVQIIEKASQREELNTPELIKELQTKDYNQEEISKIIQKTEEVWPQLLAQKKEISEKQISPEIKEKIVEGLKLGSQNRNEKIFEIVEDASLKNEQGYKVNELKKELKKRINDPEKIDSLIQRVEEVRAEIKIEEKATEIAKITYEKLLEKKLPINKNLQTKIKNKILIAWRNGDEIKIPLELAEINETKVITKEAEGAANIFKNQNIIAIVNYRREILGKEIRQELRKNGIQDETLIREYAAVVNKLTNNSESARIEENRSDIYNFVKNENPNKGPGEIERSIDEARFMASNVVMAPKKFNKLVQKYNILREKIGSDKLPKIKEVRVVEKMTAVFKESPKLLKLMNGAQKMIGIWEKVGAFPGNLLTKIGVKKAGLKVLEKIGGQAAIELVKNSAVIIAKEGTVQGVKSIAVGIMGKGAVVAGGSTGAGTGIAAVVAAFQALPVVGQVIAVVAIAVVAVVAIVKPIVKAAKKLIYKITGIDMNGVKRFLSETLGLGKFIGNVGQFFFDLGTFLIGIPALFGLINLAAIVTPVVIFFFLGTFTYSLLSENLLSSLIPPVQTGGGYCVLKSSLVSEGGDGSINCDQRAPENDFQGINRASFVSLANRWTTGKNYSEECYNDTVNRALCAGINPAYALWAWVHESGASNYSIENVEDFGIHGQPSAPPKNYSAQLNYFLKLDPGSACVDDPRIGGDYWLAFATNYLNGSCDPDEKNPISGGTGRDYLAEMQNTWGWVSSLPMPDSINVPVAGKNCDQIGDGSDLPITDEYTDENGDVWVCFGDVGDTPGEIPNFDPWDPSIPVPEGCPSGLPSAGYFTQGPFAPGCSHQNMGVPAIDLGAGAGTPIYATHPGVAVLSYDDIYGFFIDVHGKCEGKDFYTRYAHMPQGGYRVGNNQTVSAGQQIGVVNNTGSSTGNHLHYHITGLDTNKFGQYLGLDVHTTQALWGCCEVCPTRP
jgi:hypothetical protein